jgi:thiol-disulfide isomerase/thioredoxin
MSYKFKYFLSSVLLVFLFISCEKNKSEELSISSEEVKTFLTSNYFEIPPNKIQFKDLKFLHVQADQFTTLKKRPADIIILNFWATWCRPCLVEMPEMNKLQLSLGKEKTEIIAINYGDSKEQVKSFQQKYDYSFTVGIAEQEEIMHTFQVQGLPTTFILTKKGFILGRLVGPAEWNDKRFITFFKKLHTFINGA